MHFSSALISYHLFVCVDVPKFENPSYMANNELEAQEGAISFDDFADDNFPRADDDDDDDDDGYTAGYSEVMGAH